MSKNKGKISGTKQIAIIGVFLALSIVFLFLSGIIPGIELTMFAMAGIMVTLVIRETNISGGLLIYLASLLLGLVLIPNKFAILPYCFFFGPYGIIREFIEKNNNIAIKYILKFICFNILTGLGFMIFGKAFLSDIVLPDYAWPILIIGAEIMFLLYDTILKLAIKVIDGARGIKQ